MGKEHIYRKMTFNNELVRQRRHEMGKTQKQVADDLNIKIQNYMLWERGKTKPTIDVTISAEKFAEYFGCKKEEIFIIDEIAVEEKNKFDGSVLRKMRHERGLTAGQVVEEFKKYCRDGQKAISDSSIRKYETNVRKPSEETLKILSKVFNCSVTDFQS